mmetsp:Transcript_110940/g.173531  ORF Transcript_110940/g.173531 Transcript_110940/m.173531 type:complete len:195 (-) Transcript_110940:62-646(-)
MSSKSKWKLLSVVFPLYHISAALDTPSSCQDDAEAFEGDAGILLQRQHQSTIRSLPADDFVSTCVADLPSWAEQPSKLMDLCGTVLPAATCKDVSAILGPAPWSQQAVVAVCGSVRAVLVERGAVQEDINGFGSQLLAGDEVARLLEARVAVDVDIVNKEGAHRSLDSVLDTKGGWGGSEDGGNASNATNETNT